jgi:hypothetical protein
MRGSAQAGALCSGGFCCPRLPRYYGPLRLPTRRRLGLRRFAPYTLAYGSGTLRRPRGISSVPSRLLHFVPSLQTPGVTAASVPHVSAAVAVFVETQATRPPHPRTLPVINVRAALTAPNAFPLGTARNFARPPDWVLRLVCRVCSDVTGCPITPDPWLPGSWGLARGRTFHLPGRRGSRPAMCH